MSSAKKGKAYIQVLAEAKDLRARLLAYTRDVGPITVREATNLMERPESSCRDCLARMSIGGYVRSVRGRTEAGLPEVRYHFVSMEGGGPNCEKPNQPVYREYPPNKVRDPYALPVDFFRADAP